MDSTPPIERSRLPNPAVPFGLAVLALVWVIINPFIWIWILRFFFDLWSNAWLFGFFCVMPGIGMLLGAGWVYYTAERYWDCLWLIVFGFAMLGSGYINLRVAAAAIASC